MSSKPKPLVAVGTPPRELAPQETCLARAVWVIDLGTHYNERFKNTERKVMITWELPEHLMASGEPFVISKKYTLSLAPKAWLRKDLQSWRGKDFTQEDLDKGFTLKSVLNQLCYINIVHKEVGEKTYANISAITALPKSARENTKKLAVNKLIYFDFAEFSEDTFEAIPEWIRKTIQESFEYQAIYGDESETELEDEEPPPHEDVPF